MASQQLQKNSSNAPTLQCVTSQERPVLTPRADIYETPESIVLLADMPGVAISDVNITFEQHVLTLEGAQHEVDHGDYKLAYSEAETGTFRRVFHVTTDIERDKMSATMQNGVLRVTLPKAAPARITKITVQGS